jgi:hypothetical protein
VYLPTGTRLGLPSSRQETLRAQATAARTVLLLQARVDEFTRAARMFSSLEHACHIGANLEIIHALLAKVPSLDEWQSRPVNRKLIYTRKDVAGIAAAAEAGSVEGHMQSCTTDIAINKQV